MVSGVSRQLAISGVVVDCARVARKVEFLLRERLRGRERRKLEKKIPISRQDRYKKTRCQNNLFRLVSFINFLTLILSLHVLIGFLSVLF